MGAAVESDEPRHKGSRLLWLFVLLTVFTAGCRLLLDWLVEAAPGYGRIFHGGVGIVYITLLVVFVMKPLFELSGISVYRPGRKDDD